MNVFNEELITAKEVCDFLRVSLVTLWNWRNKGIFPNPIKIDRKLLWKKSDIEAYLREKQGKEESSM
ncbi:MAG: helix-turn-helix domain-containing protein [Holosporaceae bacterium]|jgi:predicted DNA-binding transcriptional regulator AlpA|nr:helix-turn-helix domain-containing protein [Holosporaceae bacterium]